MTMFKFTLGYYCTTTYNTLGRSRQQLSCVFLRLWLRSYAVAVLASCTPAGPSNSCNLASPSGVYILYPGTSGRSAARRLGCAGQRAGNRPGKGGKELSTSLQHACNYLPTMDLLRRGSGSTSALHWTLGLGAVVVLASCAGSRALLGTAATL